jgi:hypothetical protein
MATTLTFPLTIEVAEFSLAQQRRDVLFNSAFGSQALENSPPLWAAALTTTPDFDTYAADFKILVMQLRGKVNRLALWDLGRPAPLGTLRGTLTLSALVAVGATSMTITGGVGQANTTLKKGDMLGLGTGTTQQLVMVMADATANVSGVITVTTEPPLRNGFAAASAVTWDKPCALFRLTASKNGWRYSPGIMVDGMSMDLIEDWR